MASSQARTVDEYLAALPDDRRSEVGRVRTVILRNLPRGYEEVIDFGVIAYVVPQSRFRSTHNGHPLMFAALGASRSYNTVYLMSVYTNPTRTKQFAAAFAKAGKKLDMGKSCVHFKSADDLALDAVGDVIASMPVDDWIAVYEASRLLTKAGQAKAKKAADRKVATTTGGTKTAIKRARKTGMKSASKGARS